MLRRAKRKSGFTLIELMLVLALIALVAFISYPAFDAWFQGQKLSEAVDQVRTLWIKARTNAMEEGQPYRFAWEMNSGRFRAGPDVMENWPELAGAANGPHLASSDVGMGLMEEKELPEGVRFVAGEPGSGGSQDAIIFQSNGIALILAPDGTEKPETKVIFADHSGQMRALRIRGMTGVVTVESVR